VKNRENTLSPITLQDVEQGYKNGMIHLIDSPHKDGAVCEIGEYWFYFGGMTAEECTAKEYRENIPEEDIISEIFTVLEDMRRHPEEFENEYRYYRAVLA